MIEHSNDLVERKEVVAARRLVVKQPPMLVLEPRHGKIVQLEVGAVEEKRLVARPIRLSVAAHVRKKALMSATACAV